METFKFKAGSSPLVVSMPHSGSLIPDALRGDYTASGLMVPDTDWNLADLYDFFWAMEVTVIHQNYSRYVIDLNRDPDNKPLYPEMNMNHPGLTPTATFDDVPIYRPGREPDQDEIRRRRNIYWRPYHAQLQECLNTVRSRHSIAVLFDCHSIKSVVPRYQEHRIPDYNLGTADGTSCALDLRSAIADVLEEDSAHTLAIDGIFKGGYITRHYGNPESGIHAFQLEQSWSLYMDEASTPVYSAVKADRIKPTLKRMVETVIGWAERQGDR